MLASLSDGNVQQRNGLYFFQLASSQVSFATDRRMADKEEIGNGMEAKSESGQGL